MNITESVGKILESEHLLGGKFYDRFFVECPHLKQYFDGVDMDRQSAMLTSAIVLVETMHSKAGDGLSPYLRLLGTDHRDRGISADDFTDWAESMLRTLDDFHGDDWSKELEREWYAAMMNAVKIMLESYDS
ncbi:globin domain-containing protein [Planctomycetes bacterium K23_9]|uniref:Flavohemoprotein n=1 Tax=Stieleria marina TaxID=1930275 RepID=A0A517NRK9_9BACT|nr:Flavohemoprotein [Planctomycetes bacterium K23_9]